jgi:3-hydroxyisobutyrate dehydrogenase
MAETNTDNQKLRVGFIGIGTMGRGMVKNLVAAGFPVTIFARNPEKVQDVLTAGGVKLVGSSKAVAENSDITITMVPDSPQVEEVILGEAGVLAGAKPATIIVDMSTINPATSRKVATACQAQGVEFLDAPVSGGSIGADAGTLTIMVGGEHATFERCLPVFQAMGRADAIFHLGPVGLGETVKIVNNVLGGIIAAAVSQALLMGVKAGADINQMTEVVGKSSGASWQLANAFPRNVYTGAFTPGFFTELMRKDIGLARELGEAMGVEMTLADAAYPLYTAALEAGYGREDYTAIIKPLEQALGVEVRTTNTKNS